jgi:hypothetical protein
MANYKIIKFFTEFNQMFATSSSSIENRELVRRSNFN